MRLDLSHNDITESGAELLADALQVRRKKLVENGYNYQMEHQMDGFICAAVQ